MLSVCGTTKPGLSTVPCLSFLRIPVLALVPVPPAPICQVCRVSWPWICVCNIRAAYPLVLLWLASAPSPAELLQIWQGVLWSLSAPTSADPECYNWREVLLGLQLYSWISQDVVTKRKHPRKYEKTNLTMCLGVPPSATYVRQEKHVEILLLCSPPLFETTFQYVEVLLMDTWSV